MQSTHEPKSFMTDAQRAYIQHMTEQFDKFAEAMQALDAGVGRFSDVIETISETAKVKIKAAA